MAAVVAEPDAASVSDGLQPVRVYAGVNRPIEVLLPASKQWESGGLGAEVLLLDARSGRVLQRAAVARGSERVDLASLFPVLWTRRDHAVLVAQLAVSGRPTGPGVMLEPLLEPTRTRSALQGMIERSIQRRRFDVLRDLASLSEEHLARLAQQIDKGDEDSDETPDGSGAAASGASSGRDAMLSGYRLHRDQQVVLETTAGTMVLQLRYDRSPRTAAWFASLVEGGYYDGTAFHRIVARDRAGNPFIAQAGDPTWTGRGGAGLWIDFEASDLEHDFGVVSLARQPDDPNSNGAQFFIALSRAGCARLDGRYVSFAEVVEGGAVLGVLMATPVGPRDPGVAGSPSDRPLDPPVIERAYLRGAPAYPERPTRVKQEEAEAIER